MGFTWSHSVIVLCIDVGGTHIKALCSNMSYKEERIVPTALADTPESFITSVKSLTNGWSYDAITIGFPSVVRHGRVVVEPAHLGSGWIDFDLTAAFGVPTRVINDAAMQAMGSYTGGRMLFLGFGTGLGSAMILDGIVQPMELGHLPFRNDCSYEDAVGQSALESVGEDRWCENVMEVVRLFQFALQPDEIVLGGGNSARLNTVPKGVRLGDNRLAFAGGFRLWNDPIFRSEA